MLDRVTATPMSSYDLLTAVDRRFPGCLDEVRYAYWALVGKGELTRTPDGVQRGKTRA